MSTKGVIPGLGENASAIAAGGIRDAAKIAAGGMKDAAIITAAGAKSFGVDAAMITAAGAKSFGADAAKTAFWAIAIVGGAAVLVGAAFAVAALHRGVLLLVYFARANIIIIMYLYLCRIFSGNSATTLLGCPRGRFTRTCLISGSRSPGPIDSAGSACALGYGSAGARCATTGCKSQRIPAMPAWLDDATLPLC